EHEQVSAYYDPTAGYRGIIAIHSTVLGPSLGGTRFWNYASDEEALVDALRLARGMTYKAAVAGLNLGGGKSVIIGDNRTTRREALFRAHGRRPSGPTAPHRGCAHRVHGHRPAAGKARGRGGRRAGGGDGRDL